MLGDSAEGCVYVVDSHSHSHGPSYGALIAVSSRSSSVRTIAVYLSEFFINSLLKPDHWIANWKCCKQRVKLWQCPR